MTFYGYSDRLALYVEDVVEKIRGLGAPTPAEFGRALDAVRREQQSFDVLQPYSHAGYFLRLASARPESAIEALRAQTDAATPEQVRDFGARLASGRGGLRLFAQALAHGNLGEADLGRIAKVLDRLPLGAGVPHGELARVRQAKLPAGVDGLIVRPEPNPQNENNALVSVYWAGDEQRDAVMAELLQLVLADPFYTRLRTEQQLGYIVSAQADRVGLVARFSLVIQSSTKAPDALLQAVDAFLEGFRAELASLGEARFQGFKAALSERILRRDERLSQEVARWWGEIVSFQYRWDRRREEAAVAEEATLRDLLAFFDRTLAGDAPGRRRLTSAVFAAGPSREAAMRRFEEQAAALGTQVVRDPQAFCEALPAWPLQDRLGALSAAVPP